MIRLRSLALIALGALLLPGCTTFDREWRVWSPPTAKPAKGKIVFGKTEPPPTPQTAYDGRWLGRWTSQRHRAPFSKEMEGGELRCIFTQIDPYRYRANFRAEWLLGASTFRSELYGHVHDGVLHLKGEIPVSKVFGGNYRYDGTVTGNHFVLHYDSSYDTGTFEMRKVR